MGFAVHAPFGGSPEDRREKASSSDRAISGIFSQENRDEMPFDEWDGPVCIAEGITRYAKTVSWIRLYIEVEGPEFFGGVTGAGEDFEVALVDGKWRRFETALARTPKGELIMRLRGCTTLEMVYERVGEGEIIDEEMDGIEDLAKYLEWCISDH
ncbi:MAG: hypothetical protein A4E48_02174 [Methanosaeta sp. PtaU1.Bin060]|nr:MAG: hypothetical protein A4E48_02174 [Methanosaeta sp. PtaU1.Bin060]